MTLIKDYDQFDALGLAEGIAKGDFTSQELMETTRSRADALNPELNAIVISFDDPIGEDTSGPFAGVPFLLKDLGAELEGTRLTNGCAYFKENICRRTHLLTERLLKAGFQIFGRTNTPEFGFTTTTRNAIFGDTKNPWDLTKAPGGSSGGAGAAVAAGIVPAAHASDGGGSIRIPASSCGLFGLKPTRNRVTLSPIAGDGWSGLATNHAITRSVRDSAAILDVLSGRGPGDPYTAPPPLRPFAQEVGTTPGALKIGVLSQPITGVDLHPDVEKALKETRALLTGLGHSLEEVVLDVDPDLFLMMNQTIIQVNLATDLNEAISATGRPLGDDDLEPLTRFAYEAGQTAQATDFVKALHFSHQMTARVDDALARFDVILTPTMAVPPVELGSADLGVMDDLKFLTEIRGMIAFTSLFNQSGHPAMSVPLYWNAENLPIGMQFVGPYGDEALLYRLAGHLEQAQPWFNKRPPMAHN